MPISPHAPIRSPDRRTHQPLRSRWPPADEEYGARVSVDKTPSPAEGVAAVRSALVVLEHRSAPHPCSHSPGLELGLLFRQAQPLGCTATACAADRRA